LHAVGHPLSYALICLPWRRTANGVTNGNLRCASSVCRSPSSTVNGNSRPAPLIRLSSHQARLLRVEGSRADR
jgi:hypothetical protein